MRFEHTTSEFKRILTKGDLKYLLHFFKFECFNFRQAMSLIKVFPFVKKEQLPRASLYDGGVTKQSNGARSSGATRKRVTELCSCILSDFGAI